MLEVGYVSSTARGLFLTPHGLPRGARHVSLFGGPLPSQAFAVAEVLEIPSGVTIDRLEIIEPVPGTTESWKTQEIFLSVGDRIIVAIGGRYANRSISGRPPSHEVEADYVLDLLNTGGVAGISDNPKSPVIKLRVIGGVEHRGRAALISDFQVIPSGVPPLDDDFVPETPIVMVMGSEMDVGKTTCAAALAFSLRAAGIKVTYAKLTGTGRMRDLMRVCYGKSIGYFDSSRLGWDFVDTGLATTYPVEPVQTQNSARVLLRHAAMNGEIVLAEIADSPQFEGSLPVANDSWINSWFARSGLAIFACDTLDSKDAVEWVIARMRMERAKMLISGLLANDDVVRREMENLTGIRTVSCMAPSILSPMGLKAAGGALADWVIHHIIARRKILQ